MDELSQIATAGDFLRLAAKNWLELSGIEKLREFYTICQQVIKNDDVWLKQHRAAVRDAQASPEVRLFLIQKGAANILTLMHEATEASEPDIREAAKAALTLREDLPSLLQAQNETMKVIDAVLERFDGLGRNGWVLPLHMNMVSFRDFHRLIARHDTTQKEIEDWFIKHYRSGALAVLSEDLLSRNHLLTIWRPLIEQCLQAFERGHYQICIPSLLLIFEGALAEPWSVAFQTKKKRENFFKGKISGATSRPVEQYMWKSLEAFTEVVFEDSVSSKKLYPVPKRNLVLHGKGDPKTWNEAACLRLFQALSAVTFLASLNAGNP